MFSDELRKHAAAIIDICRRKGLKISTAESCTGGLIAALFTEVPGSSVMFERGFVTYSNLSKTQSIGVDEELIKLHGAVSEAVAAAMAHGAKQRAKTDIAVAVTGIAGPEGGTVEKPVGTVCIAVAADASVTVKTFHFKGNRSEIRMASVAQALSMIKMALSSIYIQVA